MYNQSLITTGAFQSAVAYAAAHQLPEADVALQLATSFLKGLLVQSEAHEGPGWGLGHADLLACSLVRVVPKNTGCLR